MPFSKFSKRFGTSLVAHYRARRQRARKQANVPVTATSIAQILKSKQGMAKQFPGATSEGDNLTTTEKKVLGFCAGRSAARSFGLSFTIPDRIAAEIGGGKKIRGNHPLRITRVPSGGPKEFHRFIEMVQAEVLPVKGSNIGKRPDPKRLYHRNRLNDWHVQVLYADPTV